MAISRGLNNLNEQITPLTILQEKLSRAEFVRNQKICFPELYSHCLAGENFEYIDEKAKKPVTYKLVSDLLMIDKDFFKILVPDNMIGLLLSYTHLLGHKGRKKMAADMSSYYFENMYTAIQNFLACCYSCFLSYKGKKSKLGIYPTPSYPFQEIMIDLLENLNISGGYSHLLILTCLLTDFTIIVPLKGKTNSEISKALLSCVFQQFTVAKIHSDNGPGFRANGWLETMAALGIQVVATSALHPEGRGTIEKRVGIIKLLMRKMLAIRQDLNWEYIPYLISAILNNTVSGKTGFKPSTMVFGSNEGGPPFMKLECSTPPPCICQKQ